MATSARTCGWLPRAIARAEVTPERGLPRRSWGSSAPGEAPSPGQRPRRQRQPRGFGEGERRGPSEPVRNPPVPCVTPAGSALITLAPSSGSPAVPRRERAGH